MTDPPLIKVKRLTWCFLADVVYVSGLLESMPELAHPIFAHQLRTAAFNHCN